MLFLFSVLACIVRNKIDTNTNLFVEIDMIRVQMFLSQPQAIQLVVL
jgi:hypothetical protein